MKPVVSYAIAAVLLAASIPLYWVVMHPDALRHVRASASISSSPDVYATHLSSPDPQRSSAAVALAQGRARCVQGVVYRTFGHVIEPWPGTIRCAGDPGIVLLPAEEQAESRRPLKDMTVLRTK